MSVRRTARVQAVLVGIKPTELASRVADTVDAALVALQTLQAARVRPTPTEAVTAVRACVGLLSHAFNGFPAPLKATPMTDDTFEMAFVRIEQEGGHGLMPSLLSNVDSADEAAAAAHVYGRVLKGRLLHLAEQLEAVVADNQTAAAIVAALLGSLLRAVQGVLFGVLAPFAGRASRAEVWLDYRSTIHEERALREALVRLQDLERFWADDATGAAGLRHIIADVKAVAAASNELAAVIERYEAAGRPALAGDVPQWSQLVAQALERLTQKATPSY